MAFIDGIVYKSTTGHTQRYAEMLSAKTGIKAYDVRSALSSLPKGSNIIFMGWIRSRDYMGYGFLLRKFNVRAACVVGAIRTGGRLLDSVRNKNRIDNSIPMFYLRGGYDRDKTRGADSRLADALVEELAKRRQKYERKGQEIPVEEQELLSTLVHGGDYVDEANLKEILTWYSAKVQEIE